MNQIELNEIVQIVQNVIQDAGNLLLNYYGKLSNTDIAVKAEHDFVSVADKAVEDFLFQELINEFPSFRFLGEEGTTGATDGNFRWIIDPIDGTTNFLRQLPIFSISIALENRTSIQSNTKFGERILGVVYNPVLKQLWYASSGNGAFLNGQRIHVNQSIKFSDALLATGFPFRSKKFTDIYLSAWKKMFLQCSSMRRCGAASIDICWVASGILDGYWELNLSPWDIAAGDVILHEAGGVWGSITNKQDPIEDGFLWCSAPQIFQQGLEILRSEFGESFRPDSLIDEIDN